MDELIRFIQKEKHQKLLELFMILDEINKKQDIVSFSYKENMLEVKTTDLDYYKIKIIKEEEE